MNQGLIRNKMQLPRLRRLGDEIGEALLFYLAKTPGQPIWGKEQAGEDVALWLRKGASWSPGQRETNRRPDAMRQLVQACAP